MEMAVNFLNYLKSCVLNCDTREKRSGNFICCPSAERTLNKLHAILSARKSLNGRQNFVFLKDST